MTYTYRYKAVDISTFNDLPKEHLHFSQSASENLIEKLFSNNSILKKFVHFFDLWF